MSNTDEGPYFGHMTKADGSHVPLTQEQAKELFKSFDGAAAKRAADMPTDQDALRAMFNAWQRLRDLGWSEAMFCPKDGSSFDVIEAGSTGIHRAHYDGDYPKGAFWIEDAGDLWPSTPILFRLDPEAAEAKRVRMMEAAERFREEHRSKTDAGRP